MENNNINDELTNVITLYDEDGNAADFEFLDLIEYQGSRFVVLLPADESEDAAEVVILQVVTDAYSETEDYISVEDDNVLNSVFEIFKQKFSEDFNFVD